MVTAAVMQTTVATRWHDVSTSPVVMVQSTVVAEVRTAAIAGPGVAGDPIGPRWMRAGSLFRAALPCR